MLCEELKSKEELYELGGKTFKLSPSGLYLRYLENARAEDLANHPEHEYGEYDHLLGIPNGFHCVIILNLLTRLLVSIIVGECW